MFAKGLEHVAVVVVVVKLQKLYLYCSLGKLKFCNEWRFSGVFEYWVPTLHVQELLLQKLLFCDSLQTFTIAKNSWEKKFPLSLSLSHSHILENLTFLLRIFQSLSHILENLTFVRISHSSWEIFQSFSHSWEPHICENLTCLLRFFHSLCLSLSLCEIFVENSSSLSHILPPEFSSYLFVENFVWSSWDLENLRERGGEGGR